ncbi:MAG: hypothetical protein CO099_06110 [Bdellovibrio sp. CG_4_9_14_3_um_filter_39_7]|nr:MAG: hypothetical protein CO099_06110 [Bdellovibrio sp. CG_4_9_14_3_um_filter_39_7]
MNEIFLKLILSSLVILMMFLLVIDNIFILKYEVAINRLKESNLASIIFTATQLTLIVSIIGFIWSK